MSQRIVEGFSISHASILNGSTGADLVNGVFYGVRDGTVSVDTGNFDNTGDDQVLSSWFWFNFANISVTSGFIPFEVVQLLSGAANMTSSGTTPNDWYFLPIWNQSSLNTSPLPVLLRVPSRDSAGATRTLDIIVFSVNFMPISFAGPSYKNGLTTTYGGRAHMSLTDEKGSAMTEKAAAKLVSHP